MGRGRGRDRQPDVVQRHRAAHRARAAATARRPDHRGARRRAEGGARLGRMEVRSPAVVPWRSEAAMSLHALGRSEEAIALAAEEVVLARQADTQRALGTAQLAHALAAGGEVPALREAVATLASTQAALEHARALAELGAALRRAGSRAEAREHLRLALDIAHRCGATVLEHQARQELAGAGARPRASALTGFDVAHAERAPRRPARHRGSHQPRDRPGAVRHAADRRGPPDERLRASSASARARSSRASSPRTTGRTTRSRATPRRVRRSAGSPATSYPKVTPKRSHRPGTDARSISRP